VKPFRHLAAAMLMTAGLTGCGGSPTSPSARSWTFLSLTSSPGDVIGNGFTQLVHLDEAVFSAHAVLVANNQVWLEISVNPRQVGAGWWWHLQFSLPTGPLRPGVFEAPSRLPGLPGQAAMDVGGSGSGCSRLSGHFEITEAVATVTPAVGNNVDRLHLTFEQWCEGATAPLRGEVAIVANPWR